MAMVSVFNIRFQSVIQTIKAFAERVNELSDYDISGETGEKNQGLEKEFLNGDSICRVTFRLPKAVAPAAKSVCVAGDFNNWDSSANPMEKSADGEYSARLDLAVGTEYQFRYLIDGCKWENDWNADRYVKSCYGDSDNSVVVTRK